MQRHVEELYENPGHVAAHPLLENVDHELTVFAPADRAVGDERTGLRIEHPALTRSLAPFEVGEAKSFLRGALDYGDELNPRRLDLVAEEPVDLAAAVLIGRVNRCRGC